MSDGATLTFKPDPYESGANRNRTDIKDCVLSWSI
jgi:hypothetical protein